MAPANEDASTVGEPLLRWVDAFPWLDTAAREVGGDVNAWWLQPIDPVGSSSRSQHLARVTDLALERLSRWTIGQIFPGLPGDVVLESLNLNTRIRNVFARFGYRTVSDLQHIWLGDMLDWRNVGIGSVESVLRTFGDAATARTEPLVERPPVDRPPLQQDMFDWTSKEWPTEWAMPSSAAPLVGELNRLATWFALLGRTDLPMLTDPPLLGMPDDLQNLQRQLSEVSATDVLGEETERLGAAALIESAFSILEPRVLDVLARRFFADTPETLDDLGQLHGVTRERVRQLEAKARAKLVDLLEPEGPLADLGDVVRAQIQGVLPLADVLTAMPSLADEVESVGWPVWRVLDRLDDSYEIDAGWCATPSMASATAKTHARLEDLADRYGVVRLEDYGDIAPVGTLRHPLGVLEAWVKHCGYIVDGAFVYIRTQSVGDRAAAILSVTGSPMSAQELVDRFGVERSTGSLKNAMSTDGRFVRVDRDRWSLSEWGHESYGGIRDVIRQQVAAHGGEVVLEELIEHITSRYSVSASSVIAYASAHPFENGHGTVRISRGDRTAKKSPERTRRLYRRGDSWLYRVSVTTDHLRGSSSVAPIGVASVAGVEPGTTRHLESPLGPQAIAWTGLQPAFGTIRRFLVHDDVGTGEQVFCVIHDDGRFDVQRVAPLTGDLLADALRLVGHDDRLLGEEALTALGAAICLPEGATPVTVIGGYRERGDEDVADLLVQVRDQLTDAVATTPVAETDISDILDLL
ncbi:sigma factor-like helix-turn-helix DNA-binding protein [Blastococcus sp. SYSU D01042]